MVAGSVVPIYNVPGVGVGLRLTPDILADIFLGKITKWNDARLVKINAGLTLPANDIVVVRRSDGSGTTHIFVNYLSKVSNEWKTRVGEGTSVNWPVGLGGRGNEGVAGLVRQTPNAIGYTELAYAMTNQIPYAAVQNSKGQFIRASLSATTNAVNGAMTTIPDDYRVFFTNADGRDAYPISGFTWLLIYGEQQDAARARALIEYVRWAVNDGQQYAGPLLYARLPKSLVERIERTLRSVTAQGRPVLQ
jgi:phosphate transport system substrate-binding protein